MTSRSTTGTLSHNTRISTIEFWRFAFTVLVCLFHLEIYYMNRSILLSGSSAVEFFFLIAGFFLAMSATRDVGGRTIPVSVSEAHTKALVYVKKKLKAIYPILIVVLLLSFVVYPAVPASFLDRLLSLQNTEWELLLMVGTPFGFNDGLAPIIPMWFLTALIVVGYLYTYAINRHYDFMKFAAPVIGVLFYVYFALNSTKVLDHSIQMGLLNAGMVRGIAEMSLGVSVFFLYNYLSKKKFNLVWKIGLSLLEVYAIYRFFALTLWQPIEMDNFRRIIYVMIIILLSFLNVTLFARAMNRPFWRKLGGLALTMYLCHFNLIPVYLKVLTSVKMKLHIMSISSPLAKTLSGLLQGTGGYDAKFQPIPMSWKDVVLFTLLVVAVSILIMLLISAVNKFIIKPGLARYRAKLADKEAVEVEISV